MITVKQTVGMQGFFHIERSRNGIVLEERSFENLIMNYGLDWFGDYGESYYGSTQGTSFYNYCSLGTGTTAPVATSPQLETYVASRYRQEGPSYSCQTSEPWYASILPTYIFEPGDFGASAINLTEIGISAVNQSGTKLHCRQLIKDANGDPLALTVQPEETLTVYYEFRLYPPLTDNVDVINVTIPGGSQSTTFTTRAYGVTNTSLWFQLYGARHVFGYNLAGTINGGQAYGPNFALNTTLDASPTGTLRTGSDFSNQLTANYTQGSYTTTGSSTWTPSQVFDNDEVGGFAWKSNFGSFCCDVTPHLPKRDVDTMTLNLTGSWARYTP